MAQERRQTATAQGAEPPRGRPWHLHTAASERPLIARVHQLQDEGAPLHTLVVVRTAQQAILLRRSLAFPAQVVRLHELFQAAGPHGIRREDIVPELVRRHTIIAAVAGADGIPIGHVKERAAAVGRGLATLAIHGRRLSPDHIEREPGAAPTLGAMLAAQDALDGARRRLREDHLFFAHDAVLEAARGPTRFGQRFRQIRRVVFHGIDTLSPAERAALATTLPDDVDAHWCVLGDPEPDAPRHAALALTRPLVAWLRSLGVTAVDDEDDAKGLLSERDLSALFVNAPGARGALPHVTWTRTHDAAAEADLVVAKVVELLEAGADPSTIAIAPPRLEEHAYAYQQRLHEQGIPYATSAAGLTRDTPSGSLLATLLSAVRSGLSRDAVIDVLTHPAADWWTTTGPDESEAWTRPDGHRIAAQLACWGLEPHRRHGWDHAMSVMWRRDRDDEEEPAEWIQRQNLALASVLDRLDAILHASDGATAIDLLRDAVDASGHLKALRRIIHDGRDAQRNRAGHTRMLALLEEAAEAFRILHADGRSSDEHTGANHTGANHTATASLGALDALDALHTTLHKDSLPPIGDPQEGIQLVDLRNVRAWPFDHVFIPDCRQETLPEPNRHDPVWHLLRRVLGAPLERIDPEQEARRILHGIIADTTHGVHLSCAETDDDGERTPSTLVDEILDGYDLAPALSAPLRVLSPGQQARLAGTTGRRLPDAGPLEQAAHHLMHARTTGDHESPYNGRVPATDLLPHLAMLQPRHDAENADADREPHAISPTRIETYASCPARHLYGQGVRVRAPTVREGGLQPIDRGNLLHDILHRFIQEHLDAHPEGWRLVDDPDAHTRMARIAEQVIANARLEGLAWDSFQISLLAGLPGTHGHTKRPPGILARLLTMEAKRPATVIGAEVSIGGDGAPPLIITTPHGDIPLRGQIDRIERRDEDGRTHLDVVDYKTGTLPSSRLVTGGVRLQLPLYLAAALAQHPDTEPGTGSYIQLRRPVKDGTKRAKTPEFPGSDEDAAHMLHTWLPAVVAEVVRAASEGHVHTTYLTEDDAGCTYCDHRRICAVQHHLRDERTLAEVERRHDGADTGRYVPAHAWRHLPPERTPPRPGEAPTPEEDA